MTDLDAATCSRFLSSAIHKRKTSDDCLRKQAILRCVIKHLCRDIGERRRRKRPLPSSIRDDDAQGLTAHGFAVAAPNTVPDVSEDPDCYRASSFAYVPEDGDFAPPERKRRKRRRHRRRQRRKSKRRSKESVSADAHSETVASSCDDHGEHVFDHPCGAVLDIRP